MAIHVATLQLMHVDQSGNVFNKETAKMSDFITVNNPVDSTPFQFSTEMRVMVDSGIPNTANNPSIKTYLELEAAGGFKFKHMDQTFIITES